MHGTYEKQKPEIDPWNVSFPDSLSLEFCNYLRACHYCDCHIEKYFNHLEESGLFENSIIVIAADHEAHYSFLNMPFDNTDKELLPLWIVNSILKKSDRFESSFINQVDIFSTILDITEVRTPWRGFGRSLVDTCYYGTSRIDVESYRLSEQIIKGEYFKRR